MSKPKVLKVTCLRNIFKSGEGRLVRDSSLRCIWLVERDLCGPHTGKFAHRCGSL